MPTYSYKCEKCGCSFERFQGITEEPLKKCEKCGGKVHRLIGGGAGLIFKGSGFYCTDYTKKGTGASESVSKTGDSKPAPKPEAKPASSTANSNKS
ncbi:MAG: hypothetical protein IKS20_03075 [Victivallales bacterium]|nr:hypothetical protein [Victivallales bacterium]